jgi:hypothetical protein
MLSPKIYLNLDAKMGRRAEIAAAGNSRALFSTARHAIGRFGNQQSGDFGNQMRSRAAADSIPARMIEEKIVI